MKLHFKPAKNAAERRRGLDYLAQGMKAIDALVAKRGKLPKKDANKPMRVLIDREMAKLGIEPPRHLQPPKSKRKPGSGQRLYVQYVRAAARRIDPDQLPGDESRAEKRAMYVKECIGEKDYADFLDSRGVDTDTYDRVAKKLRGLDVERIRRIICR